MAMTQDNSSKTNGNPSTTKPSKQGAGQAKRRTPAAPASPEHLQKLLNKFAK